MATFSSENQKTPSEILRYSVDFTNDLPGTVTVTAGTAVHVPPSGGAATLTTAASSPYLYVTFGTIPTSPLGLHYLDVLATFSDGEKSSVRIPVNVVYPTATARIGMASLIEELRGMTDAGGSDYFVAGAPFWTDAQLQDVLDLHRVDIVYEEMTDYPTRTTGGSSLYKDYRVDYKYFEATTGGTDIFYVQDGAGSTVASSNYTPDYRLGRVLFSADQGGSSYYLTGRSYDMNAAAAEIWRKKASHAAQGFSFSTDNHKVDRAQVYKHYTEMAETFEAMGQQSVTTLQVWRSDTDAL